MATTTAAPPLPRLGTGPAGQGRWAALRALHDALIGHTPDAETSYQAHIARVANGPAPQEFKDAFADALRDLTAALDANLR